jgi:hypothetical protein
LDVTSGTVTVTGALSIGSAGTGTVNYASGLFLVTGALNVGLNGTGTLDFDAGTLTVNGGLNVAENAGSNGTFEIGTVGGALGDTIINVSGGNTETANAGTGRIEMFSGTYNQTANNIIVGQDPGSDATFIFHEGLVDANNQLRVGNGGTGQFTQNGGTVNVGTILDIANLAAGNGACPTPLEQA